MISVRTRSAGSLVQCIPPPRHILPVPHRPRKHRSREVNLPPPLFRVEGQVKLSDSPLFVPMTNYFDGDLIFGRPLQVRGSYATGPLSCLSCLSVTLVYCG